MQQGSRNLSYQEIYDKIRNLRETCFVIHHTLKVLEEETENLRVSDCLTNSRVWIKATRHALREVLELGDTSGCLPDPPIDTRQSLPHPSGPSVKTIKTMREASIEVEEVLKSMFNDFTEYKLEGWIIQYYHDAIMSSSRVKHSLRLCIAILNDETSSPREKERVQGSPDEVLSTDRGFQASGRPGQH